MPREDAPLVNPRVANLRVSAVGSVRIRPLGIG